MAKLALNAVGGLFIGFTFFKADDSQQGTQNKLFVSDPGPSHHFWILTLLLGHLPDNIPEVRTLLLVRNRCSLSCSVPLCNQLQVPFIAMRNIYEIRERPTRMYSWTALLASQIAIEVPWNIFCSLVLFVCWYWTVGFPNERAGYTILMLGFLYPFYYTTIGQAIAAMASSAEIAALLFSFLFSFVLTLCVLLLFLRVPQLNLLF